MEMPVSCTSLPLAGMPIYSPWWVAPPASNHLVPLGYYVLYGAYHVREASPEICCLLLSSLGLIGCEEFVCCVEVTCMIPELLLFPTHHSLVLFYEHIRLLLAGSLSQAESNTACMMPLDDVQ